MNITRRSILVSLIAFALFPMVAQAATHEDELKARVAERLPKLMELKKAGTVGETFEGYIDVVDEKADDKDVKKLIDGENKDRKEIYQLIADREKTTVEKVAERAAKRWFEKAKAGEYLKGADGKWKKKEAAPAK
jgi:uncharacterized protein